ncbi:MAG: diguanylate cyclase [Myxococcota bacterium]
MSESSTPTLCTVETESVEEIARQRDHYLARAVELDQQVFVLRSLLQSGKGFSEILSIDELLEAFMAVCRERCGVQRSAVLLKDDLDPDATSYRVRAYHDLPERYVDAEGHEEDLLFFRMPFDHGLLWQQIQQGDVFSVRDMLGNPRYATAWRRWNLGVLQSDVWCPLIQGGEVLGVLTLGGPEEGRQVHETEYVFLQEICSVVATNIDSTLKYENNYRILRNLQTLYDINQQLASVNDFKQLTIETLSTAVEAMNAQKANLMLMNRETGRLEIKVVWGNIPDSTRDAINNGELETRTFAVGEGVAGRAAQTRKPVRINHRSKIDQVGRNPVHCILSVPLIHGGTVMGVMTMTNKVKPIDEDEVVLDPLGRFTETDSQLALGLADQAAVNLHKARLYDASITDRLTGLKNTRHFEERLAQQAEDARGSGRSFTLAIMDLDHFKHLNDTWGHKAGDHVLREAARLLDAYARRDNRGTAFRYGGEEFCLILPGWSAADAEVLLDAWRRDLAATPLAWEGDDMGVTASVGLCEFPAGCDRADDLFAVADRALYAAKEAGRNQVWTWHAGAPAPYSGEEAGSDTAAA